ncbi:superoxide dismutase [Ni], partial [Micromonospora vinacea]|uniref:superoxide dismutase [Ni] n=1 Tax=Micromonospora vinacea TaxID=709878 RepID=UPI00344D217B
YFFYAVFFPTHTPRHSRVSPPRGWKITSPPAELVKHHLWVLWTDYFKQPHFEKYPQLHGLFNEATKLAGAGGAKGAADPTVAEQLLGKIEEISKIFWETKQG